MFYISLDSIPITSAVLYRVRYRASLLYQEIHTYGAGYVMQTPTYISLHIICFGKSILRSLISIVQETALKYVFIN